MFDIIWTDPDRELVGERRARKEIEKEQKLKDKSDLSRISSSTKSSSSSSDKAFTLRGSKSLKRILVPSKSTKHQTTPSSLSAPLPGNKSRRSSYLSVRSILKETEITYDVERPTDDYLRSPQTSFDAGETSPSSISRDSVFSRWTEPSNAARTSMGGSSIADSTKSAIIQGLRSSSFTTHSADNNNDIMPCSPADSRVDQMILEMTASLTSLEVAPSGPQPNVIPRPDTPINLIPGRRSLRRPTSKSWVTAFKPNNVDSWKSPDDWGHEFSTTIQQQTLLESNTCLDLDDTGSATQLPIQSSEDKLEHMRQEVLKMAQTSPGDIIARLKEVWDTRPDAAYYKRLEMEQKRWMLSALRYLDPIVETNPLNPPVAKPTVTESKKILAFHESQATASYLAALYWNRELYHISKTPLLSTEYPNINPLLSSKTTSLTMPRMANEFGMVYSLCLPTLCQSSEIPGVLNNIHQLLASGGALHLTLMDPLPSPSCLGHHMRGWIERNLMFNLERQFRCVNPNRLFPVWLADARLRGEGSTITTTRFVAAPMHLRSKSNTPKDKAEAEKLAKSELRTLVGRMLWLEVWGRFVQADRWWWDDPACVEECEELGTYWECSVIEAIKED